MDWRAAYWAGEAVEARSGLERTGWDWVGSKGGEWTGEERIGKEWQQWIGGED